MNNCDISIRSVQHYLYCPHRWGLIEIDCAWNENIFVTKANLMHNRVHDPKADYSYLNKKCHTSVSVFNDKSEYNLYGVTDCIEVKNSKICIVEYKPTKPKNKDYNFDDLMQVFAQKICVDYVFDCDSDGVIYYADVKKRIKLPLQKNYAEYDEKLRNILSVMRNLLQTGTIPPVVKGQNCNGCSMKNICMPNIKSVKSVKENIQEILRINI